MDYFSTFIGHPAFFAARTKAMAIANIVADHTPLFVAARSLWSQVFTTPQPVPKSSMERVSLWMMDRASISRITVPLAALFMLCGSLHYSYLVWRVHGNYLVGCFNGCKLA
jgi:hypothetical protein